MENQLEQKIIEALESVEPWQRVPTSLEGAYLVKTPAKGNDGTIMVEINPINERGNPMKRRGLFLRHSIELGSFLEVMQNERLDEVLKALDNISGLDSLSEVRTLEI